MGLWVGGFVGLDFGWAVLSCLFMLCGLLRGFDVGGLVYLF